MSSRNPVFCPDCAHERNGWSNGTVKCDRHAMAEALAVLTELEQSAAYWSEYDVPLGIVDRVRSARGQLAAASERQSGGGR